MFKDGAQSYTKRLGRAIDAAYEAYKAKEPDAEKRLLRALIAQAQNIAHFRLRELYDSTVAYDAAHKAIVALKNFRGRSALSTWFYRIAQNESFSELGRLIKKRERECSIHIPTPHGEPDEPEIIEIPERPPDATAAVDMVKLQRDLTPEQAEVFDLHNHGYTVDEIARKKALPRGTVAGRLRAAKQQLGIPPRTGRRANLKKRARPPETK